MRRTAAYRRILLILVVVVFIPLLLYASDRGKISTKTLRRPHQHQQQPLQKEQPKTGGEISKTIMVERVGNTPIEMPRLGLGTSGLRDTTMTVTAALDAGYRMIDTASQVAVWYQNEDKVGATLSSPTVSEKYPRGDIFITTKLHPQDHGPTSSRQSFENSLAYLKTTYIDLYLMHFPECHTDICAHKPEGTWKDSWRVMEGLYKQDKIKLLGVSNFSPQQLSELYEFAVIKPHVVQNWCDPLHQDMRVRAWCAEKNIVYTAYSSLGTQWQWKSRNKADGNPVLNNPTLMEIAQKRSKSTAQIVLRWQLQHGMLVIPKSNSPAHLASNADLWGWTLSDEEVVQIDRLDGTFQ